MHRIYTCEFKGSNMTSYSFTGDTTAITALHSYIETTDGVIAEQIGSIKVEYLCKRDKYHYYKTGIKFSSYITQNIMCVGINGKFTHIKCHIMNNILELQDDPRINLPNLTNIILITEHKSYDLIRYGQFGLIANKKVIVAFDSYTYTHTMRIVTNADRSILTSIDDWGNSVYHIV